MTIEHFSIRVKNFKKSYDFYRARTRAAVDKFYAAAVLASGKENGKPDLRDYSKNYYAAFAIDPHGHHAEAVCFAASKKTKRK